MLLQGLVVAVSAISVLSSPLPDKAPQTQFGGFTPIISTGRGAGPSTGYNPPPPPEPIYSGPTPAPAYSGPTPVYTGPPSSHGGGGRGTITLGGHGGIVSGGSHGGGFVSGGHGGQGAGYSGTPTKTIYVNVPSDPHPNGHLPPVPAGPPRKHYKIVFIRGPPPPPQIQPVLPPRTEQKTRIYVLVQKPQPQEQQVINVPHVQHDPEVYFVQYDKPPTEQELKQLSSGNLDGYTVTAQGDGRINNEVGGGPQSGQYSVAPNQYSDNLAGVASDPVGTIVESPQLQNQVVPQGVASPGFSSAVPNPGLSRSVAAPSFGGNQGRSVGFVQSQLGGESFSNGGLQYAANDEVEFGSRLADYNLEDLPRPIHSDREPAPLLTQT